MATPQVDVYSYGVLLLEPLTGKEPTHDPSYAEALRVVAWVLENVQLNMGRMSESVLDPSLLHPKNSAATDEMLSVQEIALLCTERNPADQPTMSDVENMFKSLDSKTVGRKIGVMDRDGKEALQGNGVKTKNNYMYEESCDGNTDGSKNVTTGVKM